MSDIDLRVAIVVAPSLSVGLLANTIAAIGIGIGAAETRLGRTVLTDALGRMLTTSANRPVPILQASTKAIGTLLLKALPAPAGATIVAFPSFARALHDFAEYAGEFPRHDLEADIIDGLGLAGPGKWVRSLTGNLKLLRQNMRD